MRKSLAILSIGFLLAGASSCGNKTETTTTTDTLRTNGMSAIEEVASDKEKLRQAIVLAQAKGTLDDALAEAAKDSVVRDELRAALVLAGGEARTASSGSTASKKSSSNTASKTPAQKKDVLDETNDALNKTTRTIERTTETVNKANETARKAEDLLRGGRR